MEIIVDTRERAVIPFFELIPHSDIKISIQQVTTGDYSILYNGYILFVIERKTWKDLASSMRDGRKENVNKMIQIREDTGCKLIYLMEGRVFHKPDEKFCRMPYKALRSHLDHLAFRDNIHIMHSKNQKNTAERILEIIKNYLTIKPSPLLQFQEEKKGGGEEKLKERKEATPEAITYRLWCSLPFITEQNAIIFISAGYHISDLVLGNISKDDMFKMKYSSGAILGKRSKKIWDGSRIKETNHPQFIKMLSNIKGLTKQTAKKIIDTISLEGLFKGEITPETLMTIQKTPARKLGKKIATDILTYFVKHVVEDVLEVDELKQSEN